MKNLTANEKELVEMIHAADNPEKATAIMFEILMKFADENSTTNKIIHLITGRYTSLAEFAKAVNMREEAIADIINGYTEPTLNEVIIIAKALNKEPEEIAQIFYSSTSPIIQQYQRAAARTQPQEQKPLYILRAM